MGKPKLFAQTAEARKTYGRKYRYGIDARLKVIQLLGSKCSKCGFSDLRTLDIHHITNPKHDHTKAHMILKELEAGSKNYQLLCANCHRIKHHS